VFSAAAFSTSAFSPAAWLFDDAPVQPPVVDPSLPLAGSRRLGRAPREAAELPPSRDVRAHNRAVLAFLAAAIEADLF
jgi:hypothetical protein